MPQQNAHFHGGDTLPPVIRPVGGGVIFATAALAIELVAKDRNKPA